MSYRSFHYIYYYRFDSSALWSLPIHYVPSLVIGILRNIIFSRIVNYNGLDCITWHSPRDVIYLYYSSIILEWCGISRDGLLILMILF